MGTNYYHEATPGEPCESCGHVNGRLHIGKSSGGWCFSLHVYPNTDGPKSFDEWQARWLAGGRIVDEYGDTIPPAEMAATITARSWKPVAAMPGQWYRENHAEPGPNGLARHRIEPGRCIAHGPGTWDLMVGEFS